MEMVNLYFLHGFLGRPTDWLGVQQPLARFKEVRFFTPDYFKDEDLNPRNDLKTWTDNFIARIEKKLNPREKNVLVGYSLGGRLALHALERRPEIWDEVFLISTNPGFNDDLSSLDSSSEERMQRWMNDAYWAEEFMKAPWDIVTKGWNAQPIFGKTTKEPLRLEKDYSRELLSLALTQWSLAQQKNMRSVIRENVGKIHWIVGERDKKFVSISESLALDVPGLVVRQMPMASHRVLFDNPEVLSMLMSEQLGLQISGTFRQEL